MDKDKVVVIASKKGHPKAAFILDSTKISASKIADIRAAAGDLTVSFIKPYTGGIEELERVLMSLDS